MTKLTAGEWQMPKLKCQMKPKVQRIKGVCSAFKYADFICHLVFDIGDSGIGAGRLQESP